MPTASGFVKSENNRLVGIFGVDGDPYHLSVDIKPSDQPFECTNATLTYDSVEKLVGNCAWSGTVGKVNLQMKLSGNVVIAGPLEVLRLSSVRIRGAGTWKTGTLISPDQPNSADRQQENGEDASVVPNPVANPLDDPQILERERQLLGSGAPIIAIIGQSGTGKSTFINLIVSEQQKVGKGLQSCTSEISIIEAKIGSKPVVVIDSPGIDDTRPDMKEADILAGIANHLAEMGANKVWVTGVLFLHRITDNKFSLTARRVMSMLRSLCGDTAMSHLMLCTTMWDKVSQQEGDDRLDELCETAGVWKEMLEKGASTAAMSSVSPNAKTEAEDVVRALLENARPVELAIQDEMVNQGKTVAQTGAGKVLDEHLRVAREQAEREMEEIRNEMRKENEAAEARMKEAVRAQEVEVEKLKKRAEERAEEQRVRAERHRQEQEKAEREMEEMRKDMLKASAAAEARLQEATLAQAREVQEMRERVEAQAEEQRVRAERHRQERENAEREMENMRKDMRKETAANAALLQEAIRAREREVQEMNRQAEAQAEEQRLREERLREEQERVEREKEVQREKERLEIAANAARLQEAIRAREREVQEINRQAEAQAREQREREERLRAEQEKAEREKEMMREKVREEIEANAAQLQEAIRAREREVQEMNRQAEARVREQREREERLRAEQERAEREKELMRERAREEMEANAAQMREAIRAREREVQEMNRQAEARAREQRNREERLRVEQERVEREREAMYERVRRENEANAAQLRETLSVQQREIDGFKKQAEKINKSSRGFVNWKKIGAKIGFKQARQE